VSKPEDTLAPLLAALRDLISWFENADIRGAIIGGVAASLLGRPRVTRDVDALAVLDEEQWEKFLGAGAKFGFVPRRQDALAFAQSTRVLLVRHDASGIDVDIVFAALPFEKDAVARAKSLSLGGLRIPLVTPEDLIIMKAVARRPRDIADIEALLETHPALNLRTVRRWVREFSAALGMPDILRDLESILKRRQGKKRKKSRL
jgi:predicted nucleotidyltransferase